MRAVILAGGQGTRLRPYTTVLPKPLMPLGNMPVLELLIRQLKRAGIDQLTIAVGHLAALIEAYFADGAKFGVKIEYSLEDRPLGTAGPLSLVSDIEETFLVMNGDLLTDLDFGKLISSHRAGKYLATVGLFERDVRIDLGVVQTNQESLVEAYIEKPTYHYQVSMGVYVFEPIVLQHIPSGEHFDLPDLIKRLLDSHQRVNGFRHTGFWLDIGNPEDYARAQEDLAQMYHWLPAQELT